MRGVWLSVVIVIGFSLFAVCKAASLTGGASRAYPVQEVPASPYVLPNTQVRSLRSEETGADYQLFIATPAGYKTSGKTYPVVFMLDADYAFAITRNIVQHFVERRKLPEMILVGIAYPGAAEDMQVYKSNRTRDYTPASASNVGGPSPNARQGGAVRFRNFIANEVIPFMATNFPTSADRTFIGHSYGGLFGTYVLLTEPELFKRYIIVSPSLWYGNRLIFQMERQTASFRAIDRKVERRAFFAIGSEETRKEAGAPMVEELRQLYSTLKGRGDPGLTMEMHVYPGDTHASVFPGAVARGLLSIFPTEDS